MTWWEYVAVGFVLVLGLKINSVYQKSGRKTHMSRDSIPADPEIGGAIPQVETETPTGDGISQSQPDWGEILLIIIAIVFCGPLGLILLWKTDRLDTRMKRKIALGYAAITIVVLSVTLISYWIEGYP